MNEQDDRAQALFTQLWAMGYELIGPEHENFGGGYAIHNASEDPKPPMGDTCHMTLDEGEAWIGTRS